MELLDDAPRPANLEMGLFLRRRAADITRGRDPMMKGPDGLALVWGASWEGSPKVLASRYGRANPSGAYLALGPGAYFVAPREDRVLIWRQLWKRPPDAAIRLSLYDTRRLRPAGKRWSLLWRYEDRDPVIGEDGLLATVDIPLGLGPGVHSFAFPEPTRIVQEVLMVGFQYDDRRKPSRTSIFVARPPEDVVQVVPLEWWQRKPGIRMIARVARDVRSGNILGDGVGVKPFLTTPSGELIGWIVRPRSRPSP